MTEYKLEPPPHLNARHQHTYDAIFRHPAAHNLEWHDVRSLLEALAVVADGHNGTLKVTRNGQTIVLHVPKHKDFTAVDDLLAIRRFLEQSGRQDGPVADRAGIRSARGHRPPRGKNLPYRHARFRAAADRAIRPARL